MREWRSCPGPASRSMPATTTCFDAFNIARAPMHSQSCFICRYVATCVPACIHNSIFFEIGARKPHDVVYVAMFMHALCMRAWSFIQQNNNSTTV